MVRCFSVENEVFRKLYLFQCNLYLIWFIVLQTIYFQMTNLAELAYLYKL
jgi:hypothetical protein